MPEDAERLEAALAGMLGDSHPRLCSPIAGLPSIAAPSGPAATICSPVIRPAPLPGGKPPLSHIMPDLHPLKHRVDHRPCAIWPRI